jgi:hypothetical protein
MPEIIPENLELSDGVWSLNLWNVWNVSNNWNKRLSMEAFYGGFFYAVDT